MTMVLNDKGALSLYCYDRFKAPSSFLESPHDFKFRLET